MVKIIEDIGIDFDHSIKILEANDAFEGVRTEYEYLNKKFGVRDIDWNLIIQMMTQKDDRCFDVFNIMLKDNSVVSVYFDVTDFLGKY